MVIIGNEWKSLNANVSTLEDRGYCLLFEPSALEVHRQAAEWFWDQEVFDFIARHLHVTECPSLRTYYRAWEQKKAGLAWREVVLGGCLKGTVRSRKRGTGGEPPTSFTRRNSRRRRRSP